MTTRMTEDQWTAHWQDEARQMKSKSDDELKAIAAQAEADLIPLRKRMAELEAELEDVRYQMGVLNMTSVNVAFELNDRERKAGR